MRSNVGFHPNQLPILPFDRLVAFTGALLQCIYIQYLDSAASVFDESRALQGVGDDRHASAPYAEHFRQIFWVNDRVSLPDKSLARNSQRQSLDCT